MKGIDIMFEKFQIFYGTKTMKGVQSFSVSYYDFYPASDTYIKKTILELNNGRKIVSKKTLQNIELFCKIVESVGLEDHESDKNVAYTKDYYYIKCGDIEIATNNKAKIQDILDVFDFDSLLAAALKESCSAN